MTEKLPTNNLSDEVLKQIKSGQVKMTPRFHFVLKSALLLVSAVLTFLVIIFLISFTIFVLRGNGSWFLLEFGWPGLRIFFVSFPWILTAAAIIFVVTLELLIKHWGFAWRRPLIYSILGVLVVVTLVGIWAASTPMHSSAFGSALASRLPLAGPFYMNFAPTHPDNVYHGVVVSEINENNFSIRTADGQILQVEVATDTAAQIIRRGEIEPNDAVMVIGRKSGDSSIKAFGIRKFEPQERPLFHFPNQGMMPPFSPQE